MHDVAYWREKAGIAGLFCGSKSDKPTAKASAGKIFNDILTRKPPFVSQNQALI
jgi:hypothetical protein